MRLQSIFFLLLTMLLRRNHVLLRASAFATSPPIASTRRSITTRLFSSTQDKTSIPTNVETFIPIAGSQQQQQTKSFGGLTYVETSEELQRVVFVLGGPGSGKVSQSVSLHCLNEGKESVCVCVYVYGIYFSQLDHSLNFVLGNTK